MLALLLTALSAPVNVRVMVPGGLDGYWAQKIELFESMKRDQGEEVKVLVDPVDSTIHFESVKAEIDGGTELYDGFVIMASWLPDFVNRGDGGLKVRRRKPPGSERSLLSGEPLSASEDRFCLSRFLSWGRGRKCAQARDSFS